MITCARLEIMPAVRSVSMSRVCNQLTDYNEIQNLALSIGECKDKQRTVFQLQREVRDPQVRKMCCRRFNQTLMVIPIQF